MVGPDELNNNIFLSYFILFYFISFTINYALILPSETMALIVVKVDSTAPPDIYHLS